MRRHFTDDHPAGIEILIENTSDRRFELRGDFIDPFPLYSDEQADSHPKLILVPEETTYLHPKQEDVALVPDEPSDGCWSVDYDLTINPIG